MPHWPIPYNSSKIDLRLHRIRELLERVGNPERVIPPTIHITGTNGKGSAIANLRSIFEAAGYSTHTYTSPHLMECNERIVLAGEQISDSELRKMCEICRIATEQNASVIPITFFEGFTAAAFLAFSCHQADATLLEVGMGGTFDATNVVQSPVRQISVITPISLDHTEFLGKTVSEIGRDKAGIFEANVPAVVSWQLAEAMDAIRDKCKEVGAIPMMYGHEWSFEKLDNNSILVKIFKNALFSDEIEFLIPKPGLIGVHQYLNAPTAAITAMVASRVLEQWRNIDIQAISKGIANAVWPARMQRIASGVLAKMLPEEWELWMDGAHNVGGAQMLTATFDEFNQIDALPLYMIHGRSKQGDPENISRYLQFFAGKVQLLCGMPVRNESKPQDGETIVRYACQLGIPAIVCEDVRDAVDACLKDARNHQIDRARILICGSLYLAGDILLANRDLLNT